MGSANRLLVQIQESSAQMVSGEVTTVGQTMVTGVHIVHITSALMMGALTQVQIVN